VDCRDHGGRKTRHGVGAVHSAGTLWAIVESRLVPVPDRGAWAYVVGRRDVPGVVAMVRETGREMTLGTEAARALAGRRQEVSKLYGRRRGRSKVRSQGPIRRDLTAPIHGAGTGA
jgi:hypothetical protein